MRRKKIEEEIKKASEEKSDDYISWNLFLKNFEKEKEEAYQRAWYLWCRMLATEQPLNPIIWDAVKKRIERKEGMPKTNLDLGGEIKITIQKDDGGVQGQTVQPAVGSV